MIDILSHHGMRSTGMRLSDPARHAVGAVVLAGVEAYRRQTSLPALLPLMPEEMADTGEAMRRRILARLARALRAERTRGRAGHWSYDINRHIALRQAYEAERKQLSGRHPSALAGAQIQKGPACAGPFE